MDCRTTLLVHTRHLRYVRTVAEHCPELSLVIDHIGKPPIASGEITEWSKQFQPLAGFSNIQCKLSGLVTEANWSSWTTDRSAAVHRLRVRLFGPDRLDVWKRPSRVSCSLRHTNEC